MRKALNFGHTIGHGIEAVKGIKGRRTVVTVSYTHLDVYKRQAQDHAGSFLGQLLDDAALKNEHLIAQRQLIAHGVQAVQQAVGVPFLAGGNSLLRDRKSTRLNSSHITRSRMPSSA